jgi:CheY-like chemotaxis protein
LSAVNGKEAVEIFRVKAAEIDAVLLDMSMPVMDGETALPLLLTFGQMLESFFRVVSAKWRRSSGFRIEVLPHFYKSHTVRSA